ncbi:hypothetical protein CJ030_MR8G026776 [Morella rubra]|uniref:Uncharacterized protein n=1 Tax=Morella rubra TaxID=262757 RepID=A0A6A1UTK3_9ROSI|nr:hypothetical protein CJ030_MR8G026776 [Morella rubra]
MPEQVWVLPGTHHSLSLSLRIFPAIRGILVPLRATGNKSCPATTALNHLYQEFLRVVLVLITTITGHHWVSESYVARSFIESKWYICFSNFGGIRKLRGILEENLEVLGRNEFKVDRKFLELEVLESTDEREFIDN